MRACSATPSRILRPHRSCVPSRKCRESLACGGRGRLITVFRAADVAATCRSPLPGPAVARLTVRLCCVDRL